MAAKSPPIQFDEIPDYDGKVFIADAPIEQATSEEIEPASSSPIRSKFLLDSRKAIANRLRREIDSDLQSASDKINAVVRKAAEIRDNEYFRELGYPSFKAFCEECLSISVRRFYQALRDEKAREILALCAPNSVENPPDFIEIESSVVEPTEKTEIVSRLVRQSHSEPNQIAPTPKTPTLRKPRVRRLHKCPNCSHEF